MSDHRKDRGSRVDEQEFQEDEERLIENYFNDHGFCDICGRAIPPDEKKHRRFYINDFGQRKYFFTCEDCFEISPQELGIAD